MSPGHAGEPSDPAAAAPRLTARFTKWGERPHWVIPGLRLGEDEHGVWLGVPTGTRLARPGAAYVTGQPTVTLLPAGRWWAATFYPPAGDPPVSIYVDICTPPAISADGAEATAVDLDLDVVRGRTGRVWVDDQDEFAEHRVRYDYPPALVEAAVASCREVREAVQRAEPPYDGTAARWLELLTRPDRG